MRPNDVLQRRAPLGAGPAARAILATDAVPGFLRPALETVLKEITGLEDKATALRDELGRLAQDSADAGYAA